MSVALVLAMFLPMYVLLRRALHWDGIQIDHVVLFSLGFLVYAVLPFALPALRVYSDDPAVGFWYRVFDESLQPVQVTEYLRFVLLMYVSFVTGSWVGSVVGRDSVPASRANLVVDPSSLNLFFIIATVIATAYAWQRRGVLFTGYADVGASAGSAGPLTAATIVLLGLAFLRVAYADLRLEVAAGRMASRTYLAVFIVFAALLLSLGGRLYVASAALMALCYVSVYRHRIRYAPALLVLGCGLATAGAVGAARIGGSISSRSIVQNLVSEPLFTSFSAIRFVGAGRFELFNFPRFLAADFLNLIPSAVFPGKATLLVSPADYGYVVYTPLGALHMFLSFMTNFGLIGSMIVLCVAGAALSQLRSRSHSVPGMRVSYAMLSGWMAFTLFRDPFSVSIVKNMFEFSVFVPLVLLLSAHVITVVVRQSVRPALKRPMAGGDPDVLHPRG